MGNSWVAPGNADSDGKHDTQCSIFRARRRWMWQAFSCVNHKSESDRRRHHDCRGRVTSAVRRCVTRMRDACKFPTTMAKGSQLSQLKSALSQAGVSRPNGKKKKSTPLTEHAKVKRAAKLREIQQKLSSFDVKVTRLKHDVGGRKIKGTVGRPAQSKQAGLQQVETSSSS